MIRGFCAWSGLLLAVWLLPWGATHAETLTGAAAMAAAQQVLAGAKSAAASDCQHPSDVLVQILCDGRIRVGLRTYYPGFSVRREDGEFVGFEWDFAQHIADFLGVALVGVGVDPKNRIPMVAERRIDLVIATMGHDALRDPEVNFIRPHYYLSQTVVVGAKDHPVNDWRGLLGHIVCLPLGSSSNILFIRHQIQVLTFDRPEQLLDALSFGECAFIVHDETFFRQLLASPEWSSRYQVMFGFDPLPWGMAVAHDGASQLAALLTELSVAFHADGVFVELAKAHGLDLTFLQEQQQIWLSPNCVAPNGTPDASCLIPPAGNAYLDAPKAAADKTPWLERSLSRWFGVAGILSLVANQATFALLLEGIGYSFALIFGAQLSTLLFALIFGRLMGTGPAVLRLGFGAVTAIGQTAPLPLLLFFGYIIAGGIMQYSGPVALVVATLVIGFYNGCNAARAIHEAHRSVIRQSAGPGRSGLGKRRAFYTALTIASTQIVAFLINAAKGSPAAGMIGVPEFLNVLTDLTSYSHDRVAVYLILLIFYTSLVLLVILLLSVAQRWFQRRIGLHL